MTAIRVGLTTAVLGDSFRARPNDHLTPEDIAQWWKRTDYGWDCGACPFVGVNYKTLKGAQKGADSHAVKKHPETTS